MNPENQEAMMAVERELQLAGTDPKLRKRWNTLEDRRITPEKEIPPMEFLFELFNKPCFPRGELVAMTGKAKSGKTFMSTILMEKCLSGEGSDFIPCLRRVSDEPLRAMWFDTEQSEESTQDILRNRLIPMVSSSPVQTTPTPPRSALPLGSAKNLGGEGLREGCKIEHQRFGIGTVIKIEGTGENTKATVEFRNTGTKQLLLKFAKFKIIATD